MTGSNISIVHYWGGCPKIRTSRFDWHHAILDGCKRKGWRTAIVFSEIPQNEEIKKDLKDSDIECLYATRPKRQFDLRCIINSYRLFRNVKCTIAHFHCVHTSPIIGAFLAGVPVRIWSDHSSEYSDDGRSLNWVHRLGVSTRVTCALAHKVLPVSEGISKELLRYGVPETRMFVAPIPIDVSRYQARPEARASVRNSLGYTKNELLVCSVGQAIYRKGWDVLIRAFAKVTKNFPQMRLLLIGAITNDAHSTTDSYQKSLLQLVDELKIKDRVNFLGIRKDVADILSAIDIFALTSRAEGMPLAILEAMAAGLPCIASSVGGVPEVLHNEENGLLAASEDVEEFAAGLTKLATDQTLRLKLARNAPLSLEVFSLDYQARNIIGHYDEMLAQRGLEQVKD